MSVTALIKFTQGANTDTAGRAVKGDLSSGTVTVSNGSDVGVVSWLYELLYVPPGSSIPTTIQGPSSTATFTFAQPDVAGSYRVRLTVTDANGNTDVDIRNFCVPFTNGLIAPPFQGYPAPLPLTGAGSKPNEINLGGQPFGWDGNQNASFPLLYQALAKLDGVSGGGVPPARTISTTSPLAGGGDLSTNRTLSLSYGNGLTTNAGSLVVQSADSTINVAPGGISVGTIATGNIASGAVTLAKLDTTGGAGIPLVASGSGGAPTWSQIGTSGIANGAVTSAKLAGAITAGQLSVGGTNVVLWSDGSSNSWTSSPTITSLTTTSVNAATTLALQIATTTKVSLAATSATLYIPGLLFDTSVSAPTIKQSDNTTASATAQSLVIQAQNATGTTSVGGALVLKSGTGTTTNGLVQLSPAGTLVADIDATYVNLYAGGASSTANLIFRARVGSSTAAAIYYNMAPASASSTNSLMYIDGGYLQFQPTVQTTFATAGGGTVVIFSASGVELDRNNTFWNATIATPTLKQSDVTTASTNGYPLTVQAQNATGTTSTGGNLALTSGTGTTAAGNTLLQTGGVTKVTVSPTSVNMVVSLLSFDTTVTSPTIAQNDNTTASATAQSLVIQAQNATGTTSVGGALVLKSGTGTTTNGLVRVSPAGTIVADIDTTYVNLYASASSSSSGNWLIRSLVGSPTAVALYANTAPASATASNYLVMYSASGNMYLNPTNTLTITTSTTNTVFTSTSNTVSVPSVIFGASVTSPTHKQADNTTASATGQTFTVQAQNATGTTATGGNLALTSGTGTTVAGNTLLQTGGTTRVTVSPTLVSSTLPLNVVNTNAVMLAGALATNTSQGTPTWSTTVGALYLGNGSSALAVVDAYNFVAKHDPSGGTTVNGPYQATAAAAGTLTFSVQTTSVTTAPTTVATMSSTTVGLSVAGLQWASSVSSPTINQVANSTASATGQLMTIQAQNCTGTTSVGAGLWLTTGSGTTANGSMTLALGGTQTMLLAPGLTTSNAPFNIVNTNAVALIGPQATNTAQGTPTWSTTIGALYLGIGNCTAATVDAYNYALLSNTNTLSINAAYSGATGLLAFNVQGTSATTAPTNMATLTTTGWTLKYSAAPSANPASGAGLLFVASDNSLNYRGYSGVISEVAASAAATSTGLAYKIDDTKMPGITSSTSTFNVDFEFVSRGGNTFANGVVAVRVEIACASAGGTSTGYWVADAYWSIAASVVTPGGNSTKTNLGNLASLVVSFAATSSTTGRLTITPPSTTSTKWAVRVVGIITDAS